MSSEEGLRDLLTRLAVGSLSVDAAVREITDAANRPGTTPILGQVASDAAFADVDLDRESRCGFPEVIFGEGKTAAQIGAIIETQRAAGQASLVTRLDPSIGEVLQRRFPEALLSSTARTLRLSGPSESQKDAVVSGPVAVIAAGTSDLSVAEEAVETLHWMRVAVRRIVDVGVAGPQRLTKHVHELSDCSAIVVVAGLEGALPSVVGGWVRCPVIGVPTSIGYGVSLGGMTPLFAMLSSCASNVVTVNIDGGFRAGYVAGLIAHGAAKRDESGGGSD